MNENKYPKAPANVGLSGIGALMSEAENNTHKNQFIQEVEIAAKQYRDKAYQLEKFADSVKQNNFSKETWRTFYQVFSTSTFVWPKH